MFRQKKLNNVQIINCDNVLLPNEVLQFKYYYLNISVVFVNSSLDK